MGRIIFDYSKAEDFVKEEEILAFKPIVSRLHKRLHSKSHLTSNYLGWLDLPYKYKKEEINRIVSLAEKIQANSNALIVIGIGGSYLGARAGVEMLGHSFSNILPTSLGHGCKLYFAGNNMSGKYIRDLLDILEDKEVSINVISKSGTTTEPAVAFRIFKNYMEDRYGKDEARKRIYVTTDKEKGSLREIALKEGYESLEIPDDIGGRYSVLTGVGLLPMAVAGIDIDEIMAGASQAYQDLFTDELRENPSYQYAVIRNIFYRRGKDIEVLSTYEPSLHYMGEWWKQLFGESEGKEGKGIFPASLRFSTDLHSMGQYMQEGKRNIFQTILHIREMANDISIPISKEDTDGLNYLQGKSVGDINDSIFKASLLAHNDGGVPNLIIKLAKAQAYYLGYLFYFLQKSCAMSGYILGVNPFNQPGVESYKRNMFALLGKEGYEQERIKILQQLQAINLK